MGLDGRKEGASGAGEGDESGARELRVEGHERNVTVVVEEEGAELGVTEHSESRRGAVDQVAPRCDQRGVDAKAFSSERESADLGGAAE